MSKDESDRWRGLRTVLTVFIVIFTALGFFLEYQPREGHATIKILSKEQLTPYLDISGLSSRFTYYGDTIESLWKSRIQLINDGEVTLIGEGAQQNVIGGKISLEFDSSAHLLGLSRESSSFPHELLHTSPQSAVLEFLQWRSGESATYSLYFETPSTLDSLPPPRIPLRAIVDGDIAVQEAELAPEEQTRSWASRLPDPVGTVGRIVGVGLALVACVVIVIVFIVMNVAQQVRMYLWRSEYETKFEEFLDELVEEEELLDTGVDDDGEIVRTHFQNLDDMEEWYLHDVVDHPFPWTQSKDEVLKKPWRLPRSRWDDFPGERFPVRSPVSEGPWQSVVTLIFGSALLLGIITLGLAALPLS